MGTVAAAMLGACGRGDGFGLVGGVPGGLTGGANAGTSGRGSTGSGGTGRSGASGGNGTVGGTGRRTSGGVGDSGGSAGSGAGTGGATTGGPACLTLDDCPALDTICFNGFCKTNACGPTGTPGPQNGALDSTCNVQGSNDGSCIPAVVNGNSVGLCTQGGSANAACDPGATRPNGLSDACAAGEVCLDQVGGAQCFALCDPFAAETTCVAGDSCVRPLPANNRLGVCEPSGTNTGGTGGTGNTGGGTGGNGTGGTGGNCNPDITSTQEFQSCASSQCGCPFTCVDDPVAQVELCERQGCATRPCTSALTACIAATGVCGLVGCGGNTGNGAFNSTCVMPDGSAGTCAPLTFDGFDSVGLCELAGTATTNCDPNPTLQDPASLLCEPGTACFGGFAHSNGVCNALCSFNDPNSICPDGQFCSGIVNEPDLGICIND